MLVKLDFEKAYDIVDNVFLDFVMRDMGFGERWRQWIMNCISTPMISVLVNGSPTFQFGVGKGLWQGDPLSPFIFNIVTEGLSSLFRKTSELGLLSVVTFGDNTMHISHLQLADDMILFIKLCLEYLHNARRILRCFEMVAGLRINFHKSCVVKVGKKWSTEDGWANAFKCKKAPYQSLISAFLLVLIKY